MRGAGKRLTHDEIFTIRALYEGGARTVDIAKRFGKSDVAIRKAITRAGGQIRGSSDAHREYPLDEAAFDGDSPAVRYWVGFVLADGCVHGDHCLELTLKDRDHLVKLKRFLKGGPLIHPKGDYWRLSVKSKRLCDALARWGVGPRKSLSATADPRVWDDVDFWRGVLDGDGQVSSYAINLTSGSEELLDQFKRFCQERGIDTKRESVGDPSRHGLQERLPLADQRRLFAEVLYRQAPFECRLERKFKSASEVFGPRDKSRLLSFVEVTPLVMQVARAFDFPFNGESQFVVPAVRDVVPSRFRLGVLVGNSGTGKTSALQQFGKLPKEAEWAKDRAVCDHFKSYEDALFKLAGAGLRSIPDWVKPYHALSTGQRFRASLARVAGSGCLIDEFGSTVDASTARSAANAFRRMVDRGGFERVVLATTREEIIPWLRPDWVFDCNARELREGCPAPPRLDLQLRSASKGDWPLFASHHYLASSISPTASRCYIAELEGAPVGFYAVLPQPGQVRHAWRGHRAVVLPEHQGLGIGKWLCEQVGDELLAEGKRFFCRTAHPWVGAARDRSPKWRPTTTNRKKRKKSAGRSTPRIWELDTERVCWSHEYLG